MRTALIAVMGFAGLLVGCQSPADTAQQPSAPNADISVPVTPTDECAMRLHDYSGALLLYYFFTGSLPESLDELVAVDPDSDLAEPVCPVSWLPYVYRPDGILLPERGEQVILHDPAPSHSNIRWALVLGPEDEFAQRTTKVIALPERFFLLQPPPSTQPVVEN